MTKPIRNLVHVEDNHITSYINLPNGYYEAIITDKDKSKTYEQVKKLWATIDDISRHEYGNTMESENVYFQILQMAGVDTTVLQLPSRAVDDLRKKVRTLKVISNEGEYSVCRVCLKGISEMSKAQLSKVIEAAIHYCAEIGMECEL